MRAKRIGIYAGTFDPVHAGHIAFALQALQTARLDAIYFLPERKPRYKLGTEHFGHRVAMLKRALKPHPRCNVLELVDISFSVKRSLPELKKQFPNAELVFLFGSDVVRSIPDWPHAELLLKESELVVAVRAEHDAESLKSTVKGWSRQPKVMTIFPSYAPSVSSGAVREALRTQQPITGLLSSVHRYSSQHWLYVSVPAD
jgi:nicotinate-nucleotide adenylyltransferase